MTFSYDKYKERVVRDHPSSGKRVLISFSQSRVDCPTCNRVTADQILWIEPYSRVTVRYEKYLALLCDYTTVIDVAKIERINKDTLYKIDKKWLAWRKENRANIAPVSMLMKIFACLRVMHR